MRYERDRIESSSQEATIDLTKTNASLGAVMPLHKLEDRLSGFWIMPYFLATKELTSTEVDGAKHLNNLRYLTITYGGRLPSTLPTGLSDIMTQDWGMSAAGMKSYFLQGLTKQNGKTLQSGLIRISRVNNTQRQFFFHDQELHESQSIGRDSAHERSSLERDEICHVLEYSHHNLWLLPLRCS